MNSPGQTGTGDREKSEEAASHALSRAGSSQGTAGEVGVIRSWTAHPVYRLGDLALIPDQFAPDSPCTSIMID